MKSTLYLCGAGNPEGIRLALRINQAQARWKKIVILDDDPKKHGKSILDVEIAGSFDRLADADRETCVVANLVARTTAKRRSAQHRIDEFFLPRTSLIDPSVDLLGVEFADDVSVYQGAIFSANAYVGEGSVIFAGAVVGHGCHIGKYCTVAPGAVLNARIQLGDGVYVGTNASVYPDLRIGAESTVGANSSVVQDVPKGASVIGVPAQILVSSSPNDQTPAAPADVRGASRHLKAGPQRNLEVVIANIWKEVLGLESIAPHDNLFEIGGNSLVAIQLCEKIRSATQSHLSLMEIFRYSTIHLLAKHLSNQSHILPEPTQGQERAAVRRRSKARLRTAVLAHA